MSFNRFEGSSHFLSRCLPEALSNVTLQDQIVSEKEVVFQLDHGAGPIEVVINSAQHIEIIACVSCLVPLDLLG